MKNSDDAVTLKAFIDKDRTYDFLTGLNVEFDQVRIQILDKDNLPSLKEVILIILAEESRRGVILELKPVEASEMLTNIGKSREKMRTTVKKMKKKSRNGENHDSLWCSHSQKPRDSLEECWKLKWKAPNMGGK